MEQLAHNDIFSEALDSQQSQRNWARRTAVRHTVNGQDGGGEHLLELAKTTNDQDDQASWAVFEILEHVAKRTPQALQSKGLEIAANFPDDLRHMAQQLMVSAKVPGALEALHNDIQQNAKDFTDYFTNLAEAQLSSAKEA